MTNTNNTPLLDVGILGLSILENAGDFGCEAGRAVLAEEGADLSLLVLVVGREPG